MKGKKIAWKDRIKDIIIIVLLITVFSLAWSLYDKQQVIEFVYNEKEQLTNDYEDLLTQYETLETDNDTLNAKLSAEKIRISEIIQELEEEKSTNRQKIRQYKNELKTLRNIMKGYISQIDSLNTLNQQLIAENLEIKSDFDESKNKLEKLSDKNEELNDKVSIASVIQAKDIYIQILNDNDKVVNKDGESVKTKKVNKVKTNFILRENPLAQNGKRWVYIRIARPGGLVLTSQDNGTFLYEEQDIAYSAKREVQYENQDLSTAIIWKNHQQLPEGEYTVDIFIDGNQIGTQTFKLK
ncbi:MAG: hypothetical protein C0594_09475 [Marinilabiliales bacterium]|nr:MAG: hypothetical protein C0594_09475 [Marinilabiliales bacterium]